LFQKEYIRINEAFKLNEVRKALEREYLTFAEIDKEFYEQIQSFSKQGNFLSFIAEENYIKIKSFNDKLRRIVHRFSGFLETLRHQFPRFFFLSDTQLLQFLSAQTNPK